MPETWVSAAPSLILGAEVASSLMAPSFWLIRAGNPLIAVFTQPSIDLNSRPDLSVNTQEAAEGTVPACFYLFNGSQCPGVAPETRA